MKSPRAEWEIEIHAPIGVVWAAMTDVARYPEWNPFIVAVGGEMRLGAVVTLHVAWAGGGGTTAVERVTRLDPPAQAESGGAQRAAMEYRFTGWLSRLNLVNGSRLQALEQAPGAPTLYRTTEIFRGLLAAAVPLAKVQKGFELHARALKQRAEALAAAAP
jgi:hypothetical protein